MSSLATGAIWDTLFITFCTLPIVSTMPSIPPMRSMTCLMSPIEKPLFLAVVSSTTVAIGDSAAWLNGTMAVVVSNGDGGVNDGRKGAGSGLKLRICALFSFCLGRLGTVISCDGKGALSYWRGLFISSRPFCISMAGLHSLNVLQSTFSSAFCIGMG